MEQSTAAVPVNPSDTGPQRPDMRHIRRPEREELAIEAHGLGLTRQMAADSAGITLEKLEAWLDPESTNERNQRFARRFNRARARTKLLALRAIEDSYLHGTTETVITENPDGSRMVRKVRKPPNAKGAEWMLERLAPSLYGRRQAIEHIDRNTKAPQVHMVLVDTAKPVDYKPTPERQKLIDATATIFGPPREGKKNE